MDAMWVVVGAPQLALGLGWIALLRADRLQPPEERDSFKSRSLRRPTALGACWLVLGRTGLAAGFLAKNRSVVSGLTLPVAGDGGVDGHRRGTPVSRGGEGQVGGRGWYA